MWDQIVRQHQYSTIVLQCISCFSFPWLLCHLGHSRKEQWVTRRGYWSSCSATIILLLQKTRLLLVGQTGSLTFILDNHPKIDEFLQAALQLQSLLSPTKYDKNKFCNQQSQQKLHIAFFYIGIGIGIGIILFYIILNYIKLYYFIYNIFHKTPLLSVLIFHFNYFHSHLIFVIS